MSFTADTSTPPQQASAHGSADATVLKASPKKASPEKASPEKASPEKIIAWQVARRGLLVSPLWIAACGLIWGFGGAASAAYGLVLVLANLLVAAVLMNWAIAISPAALMAATLGGFVARLGALAGAVMAVSRLSAFEPIPLGITIAISHLGLLSWEMRYVSLRLAAPIGRPAPSAKEQM